MKIIIDILHPAHVHFFKYFIEEMKKRKHQILVTTRNKDITLDLLDEYNIPYKKISNVQKGFFGRFIELFKRNREFYKLAKKFKPDLLISEQGPTTAIMGKILRVPSLIFWDTEVSNLTNMVCYPLANAVYTPISYTGKVNGHHITYNGYQKLAYLHPNQFKANKEVLKKYNLPENYTIIRLVSWTGNHDKKDYGFKNIKEFIEQIKKHTKIIISSEEKLPKSLNQYKLNIEYKDMHDLLAFASLFVGESATMANEAALLGTPAIYLSTSERGYINELQNKYKVVRWYKSQDKALAQTIEILDDPNAKKIWNERANKMIKEMVDLTEFMIDVVENKRWKR
jgi:uncharacterized protein